MNNQTKAYLFDTITTSFDRDESIKMRAVYDDPTMANTIHHMCMMAYNKLGLPSGHCTFSRKVMSEHFKSEHHDVIAKLIHMTMKAMHITYGVELDIRLEVYAGNPVFAFTLINCPKL